MFRFTQYERVAVLFFSTALLFSSGFLAGCADGLLTADAPVSGGGFQAPSSSKLRHAHLRERVLSSAGKHSSGPATVSLIIGMDETILEADRLVKRKRTDPSQPMVANLSFGADVGTTEYTAFDEAVAAAVEVGIVVVVSAVRAALVDAAQDNVWGVPAGTTNKSVWVGDF